MTRTIAFVGAKGGTLKSGCTLSIGTEFGRRGLRVAIVDGDPQSTTTRALPHRLADGTEAPIKTVANPLQEPPVEADLEHVQAAGGALYVFRSGALLWKARRDQIVLHIQRAKAIADVVLVDTVPVLGDISLGAAAAADLVIVPTAPTADDLDAVDHVVAALQEAVSPPKIRLVLTKVIAGRRNARDARDLLDERYPGWLYNTVIPHRTTGETANSYLRPAVLYDALAGDGTLSRAYKALATEIATDLGLPAAARLHAAAPSDHDNAGPAIAAPSGRTSK
jgi:cellulose biosynthesis protein BcsQ